MLRFVGELQRHNWCTAADAELDFKPERGDGASCMAAA
jgi:hypothetical protein